ncbi:hypothetical protein CBM2609_B30244 [Cupriavidus taiwanensis]|nr:hypothetical protein CBM2604_B40242 [Cupriavidus taiwanensis]SOZ32563.1 hypothetical protein CBM2609_B30244 [Cupriavidus taiwanensis]SOZ48158.1 hypothetical protein CBM2610_B30242 [Cupriavidus taiwanensis]
MHGAPQSLHLMPSGKGAPRYLDWTECRAKGKPAHLRTPLTSRDGVARAGSPAAPWEGTGLMSQYHRNETADGTQSDDRNDSYRFLTLCVSADDLTAVTKR